MNQGEEIWTHFHSQLKNGARSSVSHDVTASSYHSNQIFPNTDTHSAGVASR